MVDDSGYQLGPHIYGRREEGKPRGVRGGERIADECCGQHSVSEKIRRCVDLQQTRGVEWRHWVGVRELARDASQRVRTGKFVSVVESSARVERNIASAC